MINFLDLDNTDLTISRQCLRDEFKQRGWTATVPYPKSSHIFLDRGDGKQLHLFSIAPPTVPYVSAVLARDKFAVYQLVKSIIPKTLQPATILTNDKIVAEDFLRQYDMVVVKPIDSGHGNGITVGIDNAEKLFKAMDFAREYNKAGNEVLIQQMIEGDLQDLRLAIVGGKFVAAIHRVPARVKGDGEKTVKELIQKENSTFRGKAYSAKLAVIDEQRALDYLGKKADNVPALDETVTVMGVANYGQGGELIDVTDEIPQWLSESAETIAATIGLPVCGVDFIATSPLSKDLSIGKAFLIEVNAVPSLAIHDRPTVGKNRQVTAKLCDYLATM